MVGWVHRVLSDHQYTLLSRERNVVKTISTSTPATTDLGDLELGHQVAADLLTDVAARCNIKPCTAMKHISENREHKDL
jgi:hypothetical protein